MDSLYNSLYKALKHLPIKSDIFKLRFEEAVKNNDFKLIEDLIKSNINVSGSKSFLTSNSFSRTIKLIYKNGCYNVDGSHNKSFLEGISHKQQKLVLYQLQCDSVLLYDGEEFKNIDYQQFYNFKSNLYENEYSYIQKSTSDMILEHQQIITDCQELYKASNGHIDMTKTSFNFKKMAKLLLYNSLYAYEAETIEKDEEELIKKCFIGGLIYSIDNTNLEKAYEYDINSAYPHQMIQNSFTFPLKRGQFETITKLDLVIHYGIYKAEIVKSQDKHINKLFRFNRNNVYTHNDLYSARMLGLEIILNQEPNNVLLYPHRVNGCQMFANLVKMLYDLKLKNIPYAKLILNTLWGVLCSKRKLTRIARNNSEIIDFESFDKIFNICPTSFGDIVQYTKSDLALYKFNYARLGLFLTSALRKRMATTFFQYRENIYRSHTDSCLLDIPIDLKISNKMGEFKCKKGHCYINDVNRVLWFED
jgi:hypothetical protein